MIAGIINKCINPSDLCCRYGGEEFIVLMNHSITGSGKKIADHILHKIDNLTFSSHPDCHVTISIGSVSGIPAQEEELDHYIKKADSALYHAKNTGRNKLVEYKMTS